MEIFISSVLGQDNDDGRLNLKKKYLIPIIKRFCANFQCNL